MSLNRLIEEIISLINIEFNNIEQLFQLTEQLLQSFTELHQLLCDKRCLNTVKTTELLVHHREKVTNLKDLFQIKQQRPHRRPTYPALWRVINQESLLVTKMHAFLMGIVHAHNMLYISVSFLSKLFC